MRRIPPTLILGLFLALTTSMQHAQSSAIPMPNHTGSLKFAVLGGSGTGDDGQDQLARQIAQVHQRFAFNLVLLAGGNIYGQQRPQDFQRKFELPYQPLLDSGVVFRASLGEQDDPNQRYYKSFNMNGNRYYSFAAPAQSVRFFALESTHHDPKQFAWLEQEMKQSTEDWRIVYVHQPLYSSSGRGDSTWRTLLEPLLVAHNVSVVFSGGEHVYERLKPQRGVVHFVVGSGGKLSKGGIDKQSVLLANGFDAEQTFLIAEIIGDQLTFNAISASGHVVDSGTITRRPPGRK